MASARMALAMAVMFLVELGMVEGVGGCLSENGGF